MRSTRQRFTFVTLLARERQAGLQVGVDGDGGLPVVRELADVGEGPLALVVHARANSARRANDAASLQANGGSELATAVHLRGRGHLAVGDLEREQEARRVRLELVRHDAHQAAGVGVAHASGPADLAVLQAVAQAGADLAVGRNAERKPAVDGLLRQLLVDAQLVVLQLVRELVGEVLVRRHLHLVALVLVRGRHRRLEGGVHVHLQLRGAAARLVLNIDRGAVVGGLRVDEQLVLAALELGLDLPLAGVGVVLRQQVLDILVEVLVVRH
jgi:hypothetical protein